MNDRTALVVGARGVIGSRLVSHLVGTGGWSVIGLSRRGGPDDGPVRQLSVDLLDGQAAARLAPQLRDVTHVFYSAYQDRPGWAELVGPNVTMLRTVLDAVADAPRLQHVSLMQGYKVYGAHLGPFRTPARESDPPQLSPEFNRDQQQLLVERAAGSGWTWSAMRPSVVVGTALGNPMNLAMVIAVYAAISRDSGVPLRFPGRPGAYGRLLETTDAGLLAAATTWAATEPAAANQAFNVANGDLFRWDDLWPRLADLLDVEVAPPLPISLVDTMRDRAPQWDDMRRRYGLRPSFEEVSSWAFGDFVFSWEWDMFADTSKIRRHGFGEYVDTAEMFEQTFARLRSERVIP